MQQQPKYKFKARDTIGAADAIEDRFFLEECFVDIGDIDTLEDPNDHRRLILGRTGAGKTALLTKFAERENVFTMAPESLALDYISNSTILPYLLSIGVKLDIFYRLLWRHVFALEVIKLRFRLESESASKRFFETFVPNFFRNKQHIEALEYFRSWGGTFWGETEYRLKEVTTRFESEVEAAVDVGHPGMSGKIKNGEKLTEEEKTDVVQRAQKIVNSVQMKQLSEMIDVLKHCLEGRSLNIVIDRLDEHWVEDGLRYNLIRALIETIRDFSRVAGLKIIIALRYDLLDHVFQTTRDAGFQEEKYRSLFLGIKWTRVQLTEMLDRRVNFLIRGSYSGAVVSHKDVLNLKLKTKQKSAIEYILDRTFMRPRDLIQFFNICIENATGDPVISTRVLFAAEGEYSRDRLLSVCDEWRTDFPNLRDFVEMLRDRTAALSIGSFDEAFCNEFALRIAVKGCNVEDALSKAANELVENGNVDGFRRKVLSIFYLTGFIGIKLRNAEGISRSQDTINSIHPGDIDEDLRIHVHPMFWRALGIVEAKRELITA